MTKMVKGLCHIFLACLFLCFTVTFLFMTTMSSNYLNQWKARKRNCSDTSLHHRVHRKPGNFDNASKWRKLGNETYVFTAYLDDRKTCQAWITILGFGVRSEPPLLGTLILQNGVQVTLNLSAKRRVLNSNGTYSNRKLGPYAYSWLVSPDQDVLNNLKSITVKQNHSNEINEVVDIPIKFPINSTMTFGVCIESPLYGAIKPHTIMHSIEVNRALGAEWFTIYIGNTSQRSVGVEKVLLEYVNEGMAEVVQSWGTDRPPNVHYYGETLSINECAYRNMFRVKYLVLTDLDEFIVPRKSLNWKDMMKDVDGLKYGSFAFKNVFYLNKKATTWLGKEQENVLSCENNRSVYMDLPKFLSHTYRLSKIYPNRNRSKYIIKPLHAWKLGVHEVFQHHEELLKANVVPPEIALLQHYRSRQIKSLDKAGLLEDKRCLVFKRKILSELRNKLCKK